MATGHEFDAPQNAIELDPGLRERVEAAAIAQGVPVRDYVATVLRVALDSLGSEPTADQTRVWSRLSAPSFARDWDSDADAVYDDLA